MLPSSVREFDVVVDLVEDGTPIGRSYREAPEIDGVIPARSGAARGVAAGSHHRVVRIGARRRGWWDERRGPCGGHQLLLLGQIVNTATPPTSANASPRPGWITTARPWWGDSLDRVAAAIREIATRSDALIITRGIGPTQDDLTREAMRVTPPGVVEFSDEVRRAPARLGEAAVDWRCRRPTFARRSTSGAMLIPCDPGTAPRCCGCASAGAGCLRSRVSPRRCCPWSARTSSVPGGGGAGGRCHREPDPAPAPGESQSRVSPRCSGDLYEVHTNPTLAFSPAAVNKTPLSREQ